MSGKHKVKKINGVEQLDMPKPQGNLLRLVDKCPFWIAFVILVLIIAAEMVGFACLYSAIFSMTFIDSLNYSILSVLGHMAEESVWNSMAINWVISFQSIVTNCVISFFIAIVLYKLINIKPQLIKMEDHLVFDPKTGTLRWRIANISKFHLTNVRIDAYFRIHVPGSGRHASAKLKLKVDTINNLKPYVAWQIATKPLLPKEYDSTKVGRGSFQLDLDRYDSDRVYEFIPDLLSEKYRSDDAEEAKKTDYNNLNVTITIKSPLFGADWVYYKSFKTIDFVCGQITSVYPAGSNEIIVDWSQWEQYTDLSENYCKECPFEGNCGIIKASQRHTTIK